MSDEFKIIKGVINVSRITKSRLFTKDGKEGKYLRVVLIRKKEKDQYGQVCYMVKEDVTKDERLSGVEGNFIGDMSAMKPREGTSAPRQSAPAPASPPPEDDDVPF